MLDTWCVSNKEGMPIHGVLATGRDWGCASYREGLGGGGGTWCANYREGDWGGVHGVLATGRDWGRYMVC